MIDTLYTRLRNTVEQTTEHSKGIKQYLPVVGVSLLVLMSVVAGGFAYSQPTAENRSGTAEAQTLTSTAVFASSDIEITGLDANGGEVMDIAESAEQLDVGPNNDRVFVATGGSNILVYSAENGTQLDTISASSGTQSVDVSPSGNFLYYGATEGYAGKIDLDDYSTVWVTDSLTGEVGIGDITDIDVNETGYMAASIPTNDQINLVDPDGNEVMQRGIANRPTQIAIHETRDIIVTIDFFQDRIEAYNSSGGSVYQVETVAGDDEDVTTSNVNSVEIYDDKLIASNDNGIEQRSAVDGSLSNNITTTGIEPSRAYISGDTVYVGGNESGQATVASYQIDTLSSNWNTSVPGSDINDLAIPTEVETEFDPALQIDTRNYIPHGNETPYRVLYTDPQTGDRIDVSDESELTVNSSNTSVFTLNEQENRVVATSDTSINQREQFEAEYQGLQQSENITVANSTVENLKILPGITRVGATYSDSNIVLILVGTMLGVVATRVASAFAGLGAIQMTLVAGWFVDLVTLGIVLVGLFATLFIGLNMAANIDYTVRR